MRKRHILFILTLVLIGSGVGVLIWMRHRALPEAVRLLPEGDAIVFLDLGAVRHAVDVGKIGVVAREPEYDEFVRTTGIEFERDLDEAAIAVHSSSALGATPDQNRYSEVFTGHFDSEKLAGYLRKHASSVIHYNDKEIFEVPHEDRMVRVAILGVDSVAATNAS